MLLVCQVEIKIFFAFTLPLFFLPETRLIKLGIEGIKVLFVKLVGEQAQVFAETLIVNHLSRSEEADRVLYLIVVAEA